MTKPRRDWAQKMHFALGYRVVEDEEQLRGFNACIKAIIQSERQKRFSKVFCHSKKASRNPESLTEPQEPEEPPDKIKEYDCKWDKKGRLVEIEEVI